MSRVVGRQWLLLRQVPAQSLHGPSATLGDFHLAIHSPMDDLTKCDLRTRISRSAHI